MFVNFIVFAFVCFAVNGQQRNLPPKFLPGGDLKNFALREDTAVGSSIYKLKGLDPEDARVTFSISGDYFSVDRISGVVTLVRALDRETTSNIEAIITVTDEEVFGQQPNTVPLRLNIPIIDVNDNRPEFKNLPYKFSVSEGASPGATLFSDLSVVDADTGSNAEISLSCLEEETSEGCNIFHVREARVGDGSYVGVISLNSPLDYERNTQYKLKIKAEDGGGLFSITTVDVIVTDIQDQEPVLLNAPYSVSVSENSKPGTNIIDVLAKDGDHGEPRPIKFSIEEDKRQYFTLSGTKQDEDGVYTTSILTSNTPLDREDPLVVNNGGIYVFYIKAEEVGGNQDSTRSKVVVVVGDRDDQETSFNVNTTYVYVSENIADGTPLPGLNVIVSDKDVGENARFSLSLEDALSTKGAESIFEVFPKEGVGRTPLIVKVIDGSALDYENPEAKEFAFTVVAKQKGQMISSSLVRVHVKDANDNSPVFDRPTYRISVREDAPIHASIGSISAKDADSEEFGKLRYSIKGFGAEKFKVNSSTGQISVADCGQRIDTCLDFELQPIFSLTYSATDGGGKVTSVNVFIEVVDINDNPPSFERVEYKRTVDEATTFFDPPLVIKASDVDGASQGGGVVSYAIRDGNTDDGAFSIDESTGEITINRPLTHIDTPSSIYALTIRATDAGVPPLHSDVRVLITVGRDKNRPPRFTKQIYHATIKEDSKPGFKVISVKARDPDGLDEAITYTFGSEGADQFDLDQKTGDIFVAKGASLDRDAQKSFQLVVTAVDGGRESRQSTNAIVNVTLQDINNKPPIFEQKSYIGHVNERSAKGEIVVQVQATDLDSDPNLVYSITNPIFAYDKTGVKLQDNTQYDFTKAFAINGSSGEISVSGKLDHNEAAVIVLNVLAMDKNADSSHNIQSDTAEVTLYVQVYSDKNPIFASPWTPSRPYLRFSLKEETPTGQNVFSVAAKDPISGRVVRRYEKVTGSDLNDLFYVDPLSGQVSLKKTLDYEASQTKEEKFEVLAIAGDRVSQASVIVSIEDINDHNPQFSETEYHTRLSEDSKWPKDVMQVTATDLDDGLNGQVHYELGGEDRNLFVINETTGMITVSRGSSLDREETPVVNLQVTAYDIPNGGANSRRSTVNVAIELVDVNDEAPTWTEKGQYTAVVPENSQIGTVVAQVEAHDRDLGVNGVVVYQIPELQDLDGYFEIDPNSGIIKVKSDMSGKGRTEPYHLSVRALDGGSPPQFSEAQITLYIGDVSLNDGIPVFIKPTANEVAYVMENSPIGTAVFQARAVDPDNPHTLNGRLVYSFLDSPDNEKLFRIDPSSGLIVTRGKLDRETVEKHRVVVVAQDLGSLPQIASRVLIINVTDADDNDPVFQKLQGKDWLELNVEEEAAIGTPVGKVIAIDHDIGPNAFIDYKITYGNKENLFGIRRTAENEGEIFVNSRIDREKVSEMKLVVACGKLGQRMPENMPYDASNPALLQVLVRVEDLDDNRPEFLEPKYTAGVRLDAPLLTQILKLTAVDKDPTSSPIRYSILNGSIANVQKNGKMSSESVVNASDVFLLEHKSGILRTSAPLGLFAGDVFRLFVVAESDPERKPAITEVKIYVLRDSQMLRFVFNKSPREVQTELAEFSRQIRNSLPVSDELNIYQTSHYDDALGNVDYQKSGSCFQLVGRNVDETRKLFDVKSNVKLGRVFQKFGVDNIEPCLPRKSSGKIDWIEIWVLIIAAFIGLGAFIASCAVCCLYSCYKKRINKNLQHIRLLESPKLVLPMPNSMQPGSITMLPPPPTVLMGSEMPHGGGGYEWQEMGGPMDNISYGSVHR